MMNGRTELFIFGIITLVIFLGIIVIPYLRRQRDLLLPSRFFFGGAIFFISISAIDSSYIPRVLGYINEYSRDDYLYYMLGVGLFFLGFGAAWSFGRGLCATVANHALIRWPPISRQLLLFMFVVAVIMSLGVIIRPSLLGLAQIVFQIGMKISTIAIVLAFFACFYDRRNPFWIIFLVGTLGFAMAMGITVGSGRRTLVGTLFAIPITYYWLRLRYWTPSKVLVWMGIAAVILFLVVGAYSSTRHRFRNDGGERNLRTSIETMRMIPERIGRMPWGQMLGQRAVECSLLAGRIYNSPKKRSWFHSIKVIVANPIPRAIWEDKPVGLGAILPKHAGSPYRASWGPGIVGHGYYDGGLLVLILYGGLAALAIRTLDNIVVNNSNNPFVLGIFASVSAHLVGWLRGDIGTFTIQILGGILAGVVLGIAGRMLFGTNVRRLGIALPPSTWQKQVGSRTVT